MSLMEPEIKSIPSPPQRETAGEVIGWGRENQALPSMIGKAPFSTGKEIRYRLMKSPFLLGFG